MILAGLLFKIILSATLFNLSFFFLDSLGFLIVFFWIPLFLFFKENKNSGFNIGLIWGSLIFSFQLFWLLILLLTKSAATVFLAVVLYLFLVVYASLITGIFFAFISKIIKIFNNNFIKLLTFFAGVFLYFSFLIKYSLIILGRVEGYPFINPLIPLVRYKFFVLIFHFFSNFWGHAQINKFDLDNQQQTKVFYLKPPVVEGKDESNPHSYAQKIYHNLSELNLFKYQNDYKNLIVVAPESTFPFPINKNNDQIDFWSNVLPENAQFLLGTQHKRGKKTYQSVVILNRGLIINFYDKTHLMPFTENLNKIFKQFSWANNLFLTGKNNLYCSTRFSGDYAFSPDDNWCIVPQICSEFFFNFKNSYSSKFAGKSAIIFLFVNDSWFVKYFRKNIQNLVYLNTLINKTPVLYITHEKCELIDILS
ncbi:MAG: hypothetical protein ABIA74_01020 [bacterium]